MQGNGMWGAGAAYGAAGGYYYGGAAAAAEWESGGGDEEEEEEEEESDDSDSDYGASKKKGRGKGASGSKKAGAAGGRRRPARAAGGRVRSNRSTPAKSRKRSAAAYDDESSAQDTSDGEDAGSDSDGGYGGRAGAGGRSRSRRGHGDSTAAAAAVARRPRRQAAAKADEGIKHTFEELEEPLDDPHPAAYDEHAAAAAAPLSDTQFAQYYARAHPSSQGMLAPGQPQQQQQQQQWQEGYNWQQQQQQQPAGAVGVAGGGLQQQDAGVYCQQQQDWSGHQQQGQGQQDWSGQQQQDGINQYHNWQYEQQQQQYWQQQQQQRSPDPTSLQPWQQSAAPSRAASASRPPPHSSRKAAAAGRSASAVATAATASRRPSRAAAAAVRPSYYEGSDEEDADADGVEQEQDGYAEQWGSGYTGGGGGGYARGGGRGGGRGGSSGDEGGGGSDEGAASDGDGDDDYQYALHMQEELNGLRHTRRQQRKASGNSRRSSSPTTAGSKRGPSRAVGAATTKRRRISTRNASAANKISYAESGDSDEEGGSDGGRGAAAARREPVPALDDTGDGCWGPSAQPDGAGVGVGLQDEIERVLGHRVAAADADGAGDDAAAGGDDTGGAAAAAVSPASGWSSGVEFHVKWRRLSYIHTSWQPLDSLRDLPGFKRVLNYIKRVDASTASRAKLSREEVELMDVAAEMEQQLVQQYTQVERVIAERPGQSRSLLVKWEGLPYCEATWEAAEDVMAAVGGPQARDDFLARQQRLQETSRGVDAARSAATKSAAAGGTSLELQAQPSFLTAGQLRDYQLEGLNWMTYAWLKGRNAILADEMGLGKTIQTVSLVGLLAQHMAVRGPFLVVVPLSTVPNWIKEFKKWTPMVNTIMYVGDGRSREVIRAFEFPGAPSNRSRPYGFEVLITTYELVLKDAALLSKIPWAHLLVDEAHRLKNCESALYQELSSWSFKAKLLVTGTPLQNSMRELWALLHFLEPGQFGSMEDFEAAYKMDGAAMSSALSSLHSSLKPHLLRRVIKDVETSLPPKTERVLQVEMTPLQKRYYKWILQRNSTELNKGARGHVSLLNIITELKKACNHPFLFESAEDEYRLSDEHASAVERLVLTSGKMVLLDKLMRKLKETGHRVLVFSQMVRVLDIISDYLRLRGYAHQRLDGSTPAAARHAAMEAFNRPDSPDFAFLLSTRAGGLGINLATADTVIIYDSDWNPQNDLQAMSRAHRIGQTEAVNIYRFVTRSSVEEDILERARRKLVLDQLVIQMAGQQGAQQQPHMDNKGRTVLGPAGGAQQGTKMFGKDELAAILRFGAEDLFREPDDGGGDTAGGEEAAAERSRRRLLEMVDEDIDAILERAEVVVTQQQGGAGGAGGVDGQQQQQGAHMGGGGGASDLLSSFNVATFKSEEDDATFWSRLIPEPARPQDDQQQQQQPLGPRTARTASQQQQQQQDGASAKPTNTRSPTPPGSGSRHQQHSQHESSDSDSDDEDDEGGAGGGGRKVRKGGGSGSKRGSKGAAGAGGGGSNNKKAARKAAGGGGGASRSAQSDKPGAPVEGAVLRIDQWPLQPAPAAAAAGGGESGKAANTTRSLGKRDAAAFVRAVRRYGLQSRLSDIARDVGGPVEAAGREDQVVLWRELVGGCRRALETAAAHDRQRGELHDPREVTLDFFGVCVKAAEFSQHLAAMEVLEGQVQALTGRGQDPAVSFRLEAAAVPPAAKWGKALGWTPRNDAALLLGVYYHGLGHWEAVIGDARLGLQEKLAGVLACSGSGAGAAAGGKQAPGGVVEGAGGGGVGDNKGGQQHVAPKASHLETRVLGCLRKMLLIHTHAQQQQQGSRAGGGGRQRGVIGSGSSKQTAQKAAAGGSGGDNGADAAARHAKAARKAAAARAAALAAAGITAERSTPTPPPPPVHLQQQAGKPGIGLGLRHNSRAPQLSALKPPTPPPPATAAAAAAKAVPKAAVASQQAPPPPPPPAPPAAAEAAAEAGTGATAAPSGGASKPGGAVGVAEHGVSPRPAADCKSVGGSSPNNTQGGAVAAAAGDGAQPVSAPPAAAAGSTRPELPPRADTAVNGGAGAAAVGANAVLAGAAGSSIPNGDSTGSTPAGVYSQQQLRALLSDVEADLEGLLRLNLPAAAGAAAAADAQQDGRKGQEQQQGHEAGGEQDPHEVVQLTRGYLLAIGKAVESAVASAAVAATAPEEAAAAAAAAGAPQSEDLEQQLWEFVVSTVKTPMSQQKFAAVCKKLVAKSRGSGPAPPPPPPPAAASAAAAAAETATTGRPVLSVSVPVNTAASGGVDGDDVDGQAGGSAGGSGDGGGGSGGFGHAVLTPGHPHATMHAHEMFSSEWMLEHEQQRQEEGAVGEEEQQQQQQQVQGCEPAVAAEGEQQEHGQPRPQQHNHRQQQEQRQPQRQQHHRQRSRERGRRSSSRSRSRSRSRDRPRDRSRSRGQDRYGGHHRGQYSSSYRQYRRSRSRGREAGVDRRTYRDRRRSSRGRSRSYSRSRSRGRSSSRRRRSDSSRSISRGRSRSYSRGRRRSYSRDRQYRGKQYGRQRASSSRSRSRSRSRGRHRDRR